MRVTKLNIETLANKLEYVAEAVEDSGKYYYRVGDITIEITKSQYDYVISNPRLYYFSTATTMSFSVTSGGLCQWRICLTLVTIGTLIAVDSTPFHLKSECGF
ncbi:MAG: hypothetical protein DME60_14625 [Verrucomicrobia bacterium]|nr:MAG: hypothetical protein DME60_14625 [Verrucomicrobiota bacterium]